MCVDDKNIRTPGKTHFLHSKTQEIPISVCVLNFVYFTVNMLFYLSAKQTSIILNSYHKTCVYCTAVYDGV